MAASIALPPSRSTCAPASDASRCGVAMTPLVTSELSGGDEFDRAGLDLEQRGQKSRVVAVEVDAHVLIAVDGDALAVHELVFGIVLIEVSTPADGAEALDGLDLSGIADEDDVEHAIGRRSRWRHPHSATEVLAVCDDDLHRLEVVRHAVDDHGHRLVLPGQERQQRSNLERRGTKSLGARVHAVHDLSPEPGVGDVDEMAKPAPTIRRSERHSTGVQAPRDPCLEDLD